MAEKAFIGIGSNLGEIYNNMQSAIDLLKSTQGINLINVAPYYESAPVGYEEQGWFVNSVIEIETRLSPQELLRVLLEIENRLGRVRTIRWGPRVMDLDLLLYGLENIDDVDLVVPHPRMTGRAFVMVPLADLAPELLLPGGETVADLAERLKREQQIRPVQTPSQD